jgi:hypothetical protein
MRCVVVYNSAGIDVILFRLGELLSTFGALLTTPHRNFLLDSV